jgi:hypothetical protein
MMGKHDEEEVFREEGTGLVVSGARQVSPRTKKS